MSKKEKKAVSNKAAHIRYRLLGAARRLGHPEELADGLAQRMEERLRKKATAA